MVTFSCDGCSEILKKKQVDGHASRCRRCDSVTCVDCSISFYGDDYRGHTTCEMTEVDNLVAARGTRNKKQSPQESWMELLHSSINTAPPSIKSYLQTMVQLDNVPRKEKQFRNFAQNSLNLKGNNGKKELDVIWDFLKGQREKQQKQKEEEQAIQLNSKEDELGQQQAENEKSKEEKQGSQKATVAEKSTNDKATYKNVKKATKKLLRKAPGKAMKYKSLKRALQDHVGVPKKELKKIMEQVISQESKKFMLEGKQIRLVVS